MKDFLLREWRKEDANWYVNDCILKEGKNQITRAIVVDGKAVGSIGIFVKNDVYEKSGEFVCILFCERR